VTEPARRGHCPWCSRPVAKRAARCPSCGAALRDLSAAETSAIPGVTQVDPALGARRRIARPSRLIGWLANVDAEPLPAPVPPPTDAVAAQRVLDLGAFGQASVAPPSEAVRREMARLELEALRADLEARAPAAATPAGDVGDASAADATSTGEAPEAAGGSAP
jgi:hypothetical protein